MKVGIFIFIISSAMSDAAAQQQQLQQKFQQELIRQGYQHQQDMMSSQDGRVSTRTNPSAEAPGTWGALALGMSGDINSFGVAIGYSSWDEAEDVALRRCAVDSDNCRIISAYRNMCASTAEVEDAANNPGRFGFGTENRKAKAEKASIKNCEKANGGRACAVISTDCSFADTPRQ